jgi:hypothetical protein
MCRQHQDVIGQRLKFRKAIKKLSSEFNRLPWEKIRSAHIAYKKRIPTKEN